MGIVLALQGTDWLVFAGVVVTAMGTVAATVIPAFMIRHQTVPQSRTRRSGKSKKKAEPSSLVQVEGFIIRFFLFSLTAALWGALGQIIGAFVDWTKPVQIAVGLMYALIFITLGGPLLIDIYRHYGIKGRRRRVAQA